MRAIHLPETADLIATVDAAPSVKIATICYSAEGQASQYKPRWALTPGSSKFFKIIVVEKLG
jgi:hypothetical protein